jgi:4-amino-4-deoxy-L-arabinose transferase-like glycosyltransferase
MQRVLKHWWPEFLLGVSAAFFFFRELGTFPEAWLDDSLFMIVARNVAEGRGYAMPVLDQLWTHSYFLAVGPTVIWPTALMIKLFGFSVAVARLPMVAYLAGTTVALYAYAMRMGGRTNARLAAALLISFSAFVNTGKPVLGEIPGVFFALLALLCFPRKEQAIMRTLLCGILLGLAFVTKTTMGLVFPAAMVAMLIGFCTREIPHRKHWLLLPGAALLTILPFVSILGMTNPGWLSEILQYGTADGGSGVLRVLREQPQLLLRFQYLYALGVIFPLGYLGLWRARTKIGNTQAAFVATLIGLFLFYFLSERGYFRHVLPGFILLLPFVPMGVFAIVPKRVGVAIIACFVLAQGLWQLDHRGARRLNEAIPAATRLEQHFRDVRMVIEQPEVFVRLSNNPHWLFLSEEFQLRSYDRFPRLPKTQAEYCLPLLRKMSGTEQATYPVGRLIPIAERYMLIEPEDDCAMPYGAAQ